MRNGGPPTMVIVIIIIVIVLVTLAMFIGFGYIIWRQMKYRREKMQYKMAMKMNKHQAPMVVVDGADPVIGPEQGGPGFFIIIHLFYILKIVNG